MRKIYGLALFGALIILSSPTLASAQTCPADVEAAIAAACPCDADVAGEPWKNHGKYVSCVVRTRNDFRHQGCLTDPAANREIASCAARSTCGKAGAVLCCTYDTSGTCNDALPGDGAADGVCSNDDGVACDTDADCATAKGPKVRRSSESCTDRGGTDIGTGSVCEGCPIPAP